MTLLPALLSILLLCARLVQFEGTAFFDRFADFVIARRTFLLGSVSLVIVVLAIGIPRIELSDNMAQYFDERYEFRRDTDYVIDNLTGLDKLEYSLNAGREGGITDPDYLRKVDAFAEWYRQQPEVTHVQAFSDIMKRLNKNMHGDGPAFYRLPDDPNLAAQYLLLYELSLPFGSDLNDRIDVAKSATRLVVTTQNAWSRDIRELDERAQVWLRANAPAFAHEASGLGVVFAHLSLRNINSMLRGTITAMALISFILIWIFKSVRIGLLSLLPNFIPAIMSFGLWGYLVGHVGIASSPCCRFSRFDLSWCGTCLFRKSHSRGDWTENRLGFPRTRGRFWQLYGPANHGAAQQTRAREPTPTAGKGSRSRRQRRQEPVCVRRAVRCPRNGVAHSRASGKRGRSLALPTCSEASQAH